jgi:membrane fusion protein (multidrug efflux system)
MANDDVARIPKSARRRRLLLVAGAVFAVIGVAWAGWWYVYARQFEKTDDAYVQGNVIQVTPQVSGTVLSVNADDTDFVQAGAPLVTLDRADAEVALAQAQAALAQTVREVRSLYTANTTWSANISQREADIARARSDVGRAEDDLARRQSLTATGAVSGEELNHAQGAVSTARAALAAAEAALTAAKQQLATNQSLTEGTTVEKHPNVERAAAKVREAYLAVARASLPAPVSGYVAKRTVQVGQRVAPGAPLMAIIPLDQVWVDANFKEVQLRRMRIGQPVRLTADAYGSNVEYHGTVAGLGVGTGSAFALLPAQNATGNWIKVVQRIPVRIALDPKELAEHPLRVGLSMQVDVDVADTAGKTLAETARTIAPYTTVAFTHDAQEADALVRKTIAENIGAPTRSAQSDRTALAQRAPAGAANATPNPGALSAAPSDAPTRSTKAPSPRAL